MLTKKDRKKRYNKSVKSRGYSFDGSSATWTEQTQKAFSDNLGGAIAGIAGAAAGAMNTGMEAAKLQGVEEAQADINKQTAFQSTASSLDELLAEQAGLVNLKTDYSHKDFMQSGGDFAKTMISGALQGAGSGAAAGPWGIVAGIGANVASGLAGRLAANIAGKVEASEINQGAKQSNKAAAQTLTSKAAALDQNADLKAQAAYAAEGGAINPFPSSEFGSPITEFNAGGSHEENPYDGIPQGIAPDGLPNLVEEGEVKFDNYIFSDRLMLTKEDKQKYKFLKGKTYADAAKRIKKDLGIDERPNDSIAKADLEEQLNVLSALQEEKRAKKGLAGENRMMYKNGGHLFNGLFDNEIYIKEGDYLDSKYDIVSDPAGLMQVNMTQNTEIPVEVGNDNTPNPPAQYKVPKLYTSGVNKGKPIIKNKKLLTETVGTDDPRAADYLPLLSEGMPKPNLSNLSPAPAVTEKDLEHGKKLANEMLEDATKTKLAWLAAEEGNKFNYNSLLQSTPALGNALGTLAQAFNKPKYEHAKELQKSDETFTPISYTPVTQKLEYKPFDVNYFGNKLAAQAGATRNAVRQQTASNPYAATAALLVADANTQAQMGDLYKKAEDHNLTQREKVAAFNRATDSVNSELGMKAQQLNASLLNSRYDRDAKRDLYAAQMKLAEDNAWSAAMSSNLTSMFDNLGLIGKEGLEREDAAAKILAESKNLTPELRKWAYRRGLSAYGGKVNTKRKKGYTI